MSVPGTMKALVQQASGYTDTRQDQRLESLSPHLALEEIAVPQPGPGQALVRVIRAAVNPSDVAFIKGAYGQPRVQGVPAGFEGVGEVVAGDTPLVGQRVSFFATASGTWAEYALTDAATLIPLRPDLKDADAAGLLVNPMTAMAMFDLVREDGAESFIATAAGSQLGKFLMGLGKDHGIAPIAVVRRAEQAQALRDLGAAEVLVSTDPGFAGTAKAVLGALKPRVMLDAVGDQVSAGLFFAMGRGARWVVYGRLATEPPALTEIGQFIFLRKRIEGFWLTAWMRETPRERVAAAMAEVQARFADGRWRTDISAEVPLSRVMEALPAAYMQPDSKVLIAPGE
jgi:NADPH:quinone reductase-like Zn-dependent oxidoreductase